MTTKSYFNVQSKQVRIAIIIIAIVINSLIFYNYFISVGSAVGALSVIPVIMGAWLFGAAGGVVISLIILIINQIIEYNIVGQIMSVQELISIFIPFIILGLIVGRLRDLEIRLKEELTQRQQAEAKLKEYSETLEEKVAQRTQSLKEAQEKLIRQEKLAVLGQLAGSVGHELRNPLGVISNAVYFLQMVLTEADETTKEYLQIINDRVIESEKIVLDLLNLSRTRSASQETISAFELVAEALARCPTPSNVEVINHMSANGPFLFVDPQQIRQVLINLISNAYQAMPKGGHLTINAQLEQNQLQLSITDTGQGISTEALPKIFEPLFTTKAKGIGLGLVVCKNLVEINNGRITVESIKDKGSTFTIFLPTIAKN